MADAAIGVAGLALAVPGLLDLLFSYAAWISERMKVFKEASTVWADLGQFASSLANGELHDWVRLAGSFCDAGSDPVLHNSLELNLRKLTSDIATVKIFLEKVKPDSSIRRFIFTISNERRARELNKILVFHKRELGEILVINSIHAQRFQYPLLLTRRSLMLYENTGY